MPHGPTIGVLSPLAGGFYYGGLLTGIARAAAIAGGRMIAIQTLDAGHLNANYVESPPFESHLAWDHIDAFVSIVHAASGEFLRTLARSGKPLVMVSNDVPGLDCPVVLPDNRGGAAAATLHLIEHGHRRIAFVGYPGQPDIQERYESYQETLRANGIEPDPSLFFGVSDNDEAGGMSAVRAMLAAGLPSTAVVAATDLNAIGIIKALTTAGYTLPRDQAVVGFDDAEAASHITPALSSVRQDFEDVGHLATDLLLRKLRGEATPSGRVPVPTTFVARESCGCPAWQTARRDFESASLGTTAASVGADGDARAELARRLSQAISGTRAYGLVDDAVARLVAEIVNLMDAAAAGTELPPLGSVRDALGQFFRLAPSPETAHATIFAIRTYSRRVMTLIADRPDAAAARARLDDVAVNTVWALSQVRARDGYDRDCYVQTVLTAQYDVSMELLRGVNADPRDLSWLSHTHVRAGILGLWTDGPGSTLQVTGIFRRDSDDRREIGTTMPIEAFPPLSMLTEDPRPGDMVFAVPVMTGASDWGWLVTVGQVESTTITGRETANQWAALLTVALDQARAGDELKRLERELRETLEGSPDSIARYDAQLRYRYINAAGAATLGLPPETVVGRTDQELSRPAGIVASWESGLRQVLVSGRPTEIEFSVGEGSETRWYQARMEPEQSADGMVSGVLTATRDLTAIKRAEIALAHQAVHDSLTGLANRVLFLDRLTQAIHRLEREPGRLAVLFVDLDHFKEINDVHGHDVGDMLLIEVARRLTNVSRRVDTVARFGGDEFVMLCDNLAEEEDVRIIGERVVRALVKPLLVGERELDVGGSVGIVVASSPYAEVDDIIRNADAAMYQAKARGGNRFHVFDPALRDRATARHILEADLRHALEREELRLAYQPLFSLDGGEINGVEALLRWKHPLRGLLLPESFISIAEQRGIIIPIGAWVLDEACRQLAAWSDYPEMTSLSMAVNVSGRQLADPDIVETVRDALRRHGIAPHRLTLEMTETTLIEDAANLHDTLSDLAALGVHLALDDFGTGYSSLAHLRDFRVDILKIDRSFVEELGDGGRAREIVGALTAMAHFLDMTVVGEGIETSKQWDELKNLSCDDGQGFLMAEPLEAADVVTLIQQRARRRPGAD